MRRVLMLLVACSALLTPFVGCGQSKPDPRKRPDFVDTSDPSKVGGMLPPTTEGQKGAPAQPAGGEKKAP
jgi:hypothetical protein